MSESDAVIDRVLTIPNVLSLVRLLLVPVFGWLILSEQDGWALLVLAVSGASDYLDGKLARSWGQVSRVGQLLDPTADRLYIVSTLIGLAIRGLIPWWLVALLVVRDAILTVTVPVLARYGYGPLPVHFLGKAATFSLLYSFPLLLLADLAPLGIGNVVRPLAWAFVGWGTVLYWWAAVLYLHQMMTIIKADRQRPS
ncbi:MAG: hypothetical protein QG622_1429 [Actinomycetota bacterium]|nr:hypothetical protein [Actinomycetota bacterium]